MTLRHSRPSSSDTPPTKRSPRRQLCLSSLTCAVVGALFGLWLGSPSRPLAGGLIGLVVGMLCGTLDPVFDAAVAWAAGRTRNRFKAALAGASIAMLLLGGMMLAILGGIVWAGDCWG